MVEIYVAIDGDDVGRRLETYVVSNELEALERYARTFRSAMEWLEQTLYNDLKAHIIFNGGDNLLAKINSDVELRSDINNFRLEFTERAGSSISIGIGSSSREAFLALKLAKAMGKDRIVHFSEAVNE